MKKSWLALALASVCSVACFTACGEDYDGEYEFYSFSDGTKTYYVGDTFEEGGFNLDEDSLTIRLTETKGEKDEGTWTLSGELSARLAISGGMWEEEEKGVLELTPYGNETDLLTQCDGETLTLIFDGVTIVFKK
ncbi:MAG: hypothetical protein IJ317_01400 [Clostridia bacterium]|nr:hypothetical protein [Clostridia bacterium]